MELQSRGTFLSEDILTSLTANHGNLDAAYIELSKAQLKPFLMRIWNNDSSDPNRKLQSEQVNVSNYKVQSKQESGSTNSQNGKEETVFEIEKLEPEPRLELLVSNAAKVSREIEKAIQELKQTKHEQTDKSMKTGPDLKLTKDEPQTDPKFDNQILSTLKSDEGKLLKIHKI